MLGTLRSVSPTVPRRRTRWPVAVTAIGLALAATVAGPSWASSPAATGAESVAPTPAAIDRDELVALLRAVPGVVAEYREVQHLALLTAPLVSEGTMHFAPPGRLAKHQRTPARARTVVADGRLRFADAFGRDELELAKSPIVALFVDSFLQLLAGDVDAIERAWFVGFGGGAGGDPRAWVLVLRPRADAARGLVESLTIVGRDAVVGRIEIAERGGDRTVTTLTAVDTTRTWSEAELAEVFSVTSP